MLHHAATGRLEGEPRDAPDDRMEVCADACGIGSLGLPGHLVLALLLLPLLRRPSTTGDPQRNHGRRILPLSAPSGLPALLLSWPAAPGRPWRNLRLRRLEAFARHLHPIACAVFSWRRRTSATWRRCLLLGTTCAVQRARRLRIVACGRLPPLLALVPRSLCRRCPKPWHLELVRHARLLLLGARLPLGDLSNEAVRRLHLMLAALSIQERRRRSGVEARRCGEERCRNKDHLHGRGIGCKKLLLLLLLCLVLWIVLPNLLHELLAERLLAALGHCHRC
mmetsp:Transcript_104015/g.300893  ORF Transcript_104015/g.300893 Transcript_104015/m.300893 type:complete len:280 (-) Transcript_104015:88-927(-)